MSGALECLCVVRLRYELLRVVVVVVATAVVQSVSWFECPQYFLGFLFWLLVPPFVQSLKSKPSKASKPRKPSDPCKPSQPSNPERAKASHASQVSQVNQTSQARPTGQAS